ncbi:MAG: hypothetical protein COT15_04525 [Candidatus Diapherotrites archaeon CG08_land_8_20_14_0_20_34_12]|nr:MAG: hypothetical protein COT15_04525 [Candidatus Diapherotrites archaeon CG08_land_8_20_14_0_20_34_12]
MQTDYAKREAFAVSKIKAAIPSKFKANMISQEGLFAEIYECNEVMPNHYLACTIDGVGTKVILAIAMEKYDTIGIDCVAMNSNDLATMPKAKPFMFVDYLACQHKIEELGITGDIIKGVSKGLEMADCGNILRNSVSLQFGKGETASLDELIASPKNGFGFDIAGSMTGFVEKNSLNFKPKEGMQIIALKSSGFHSNGYTAARHYLLDGDFEERPEFKKMYKGSFSLNDTYSDHTKQTVGEALLEPTRIYNKVMYTIGSQFDVLGVNNTGYGLKNLNRQGKYLDFTVKDPIEPLEIFKAFQKESKFTDEKMYRTVNMGQGFFIIANKEDVESILKIAKKQGEEAKVIGEVKKGPSKENRAILEKNGKKLAFEGY